MQLKLVGYSVVFTKRSQKELESLPAAVADFIVKKLESLVSGGTNLNLKKLYLQRRLYRLRCKEYRVIFEIIDDELVVLVVKVGHRKNVYKRIG